MRRRAGARRPRNSTSDSGSCESSSFVELHGVAAMREPHIKHLEGKLWEMRMKGKDGIARAIYVTAERERVVVLHAFTKKTQKTPARALDVARTRAKEVV